MHTDPPEAICLATQHNGTMRRVAQWLPLGTSISNSWRLRPQQSHVASTLREVTAQITVRGINGGWWRWRRSEIGTNMTSQIRTNERQQGASGGRRWIMQHNWKCCEETREDFIDIFVLLFYLQKPPGWIRCWGLKRALGAVPSVPVY